MRLNRVPESDLVPIVEVHEQPNDIESTVELQQPSIVLIRMSAAELEPYLNLNGRLQNNNVVPEIDDLPANGRENDNVVPEIDDLQANGSSFVTRFIARPFAR